MPGSNSPGTSISITDLAVSAGVIVACIMLMVSAAKFGFSRVLGIYGVTTGSIVVADEAVRLTPGDPQAHQARAIVLNNLQKRVEAAKAMEVAVSLRPHDDYLWLELGGLRDAAGNSDAALPAFDRAVQFAPYYGHTHWQRGNLLVRMRKYDQGFADLRAAVASNPDFLPALIDLAWGITRGDARITEQLVQVSDDKTRLALARFFARHGKATETLDQLRQTTAKIPSELREDLIRSLLQHKAYPEAYSIWKENIPGQSTVNNGSFEEDLVLEAPGFGWQAGKLQGVTYALDLNQPNNGSRALRITFEGYENQEQPVLSQLFLVKPDNKYHLTFAVKTRDLVTGGLPMMTVRDAITGELLSKSEVFQTSGNVWVSMSIEFATSATSTAVSLNLQRNKCGSSPCPIFGQVWLDSFVIHDARSN